MMIDARMQAALARLTENEKECLRRRLRQQTAKKMALELGVSPHAVEKRLKMARAKLGVSSSLEAARLLATSEQDEQTGPQSADLASGQAAREGGFTRSILAGAAAVTIILATAAVLIASQSGSVPDQAGEARPGIEQRSLPPGNVAPTDAEIVLMTRTTFDHLDADNSGYLDGGESPLRPVPGPQPVYRRDEKGNVVPTGERVMQSAEEIQAQFYRMADKDGDGRISYPEFHQWSAPNLVRNGIPAHWQADMRSWMSPGS